MATATSSLAAALIAVDLEDPIHDAEVDPVDDDYDEPSASSSSESEEAEEYENDAKEEDDPTGEHEDSIRDSDADSDEPSDVAESSHLKRKRDPERWLKEIRHYQETTNLLIPRAPFKRLAREIAEDFKTDMRWTEESLEALQTASESFAIEMFEKAQDLAIFRGHEMIMPKDVRMAMKMLGCTV